MNIVQKIFAVNFLNGLVFWYGIEKLFMRSIGISTFGISIIATELLIITLLIDIPSGIMADSWSRKYTLVLGLLSLAIATVIYGTSSSLFTYIVGTVPYGLFLTFLSGAFAALTYDALLEQKREAEYAKVQGFSYGLFCVGMFVASVFSGVLATHFSLRQPYFISIVPISIAIGLLFSIKEPPLHKSTSKISVLSHFSESVSIIRLQPALLYIVMIGICISAINNLQTEYGSLYYIGLGLNATLIGIAYGLQSLARAGGQMLGHKIGRAAFRYLPLLALGLGFSSLLPSKFTSLVFFLTVFLVGAIQNQTDVAVQNATPSHARATVGSVVNFLANIVLIPIGLIFGWIARIGSIFHSFQLVFAISLIGYALWLVYSNKFQKGEVA